MNDLVSIIIPCFNREEYIKECIESALNQDYTNIEIIVIDDHSNDSSNFEIEKFGEQVKLIRHDKNLGLAASLNTGILQSRGNWIKRLDSDDKLTPHCVRLLMDKAVSNNVLYYGDYEIIDKYGGHLRFFKEPDRNKMNHYGWCQLVKEKHVGNANTMLYHNDVHYKDGPYNEDIH